MQRHTYETLSLALTMSEDEACEILTWTDEPELLDGPAPYFSADQIAAARIISDWIAADCPAPIFH